MSIAALIFAATTLAPLQPYGQIGRMVARPGQRDALVAALPNGCRGMRGCRAYLVAKDAKNPDALWITEEWDSRATHNASLALPQVKATIAKARPLIAGMDNFVETVPARERE